MDMYVDVEAVAELLLTTPKGVYHLRARRMLPAPVKVGRRLLWDREVLVRWVAEGRVRQGSEP